MKKVGLKGSPARRALVGNRLSFLAAEPFVGARRQLQRRKLLERLARYFEEHTGQ
jgi:hypothetical protein